jgi:hypothetical protein
MTWVDETAPAIRHLSASGMAGAVQRYASVNPRVTKTDDDIELHVDGFADDCSCFIKINDGDAPGAVRGGTLTRLNGTLYLLRCIQADVSVERAAS